ncbi:hypothetical protein FRB97_002101 [Tulasnella sp. 331]|nr:hypothetical protein FRB97_002101 [Tulasnella sp. 331]
MSAAPVKVTFLAGLLSSSKSKTKKQVVETQVNSYVTAHETTITKQGGTEAVVVCGFHESRSDPKTHATADVHNSSNVKVGVLHVYEDASGQTFPFKQK